MIPGIFLSTLSVMFVLGTISWLEYNEFDLVPTLYAQSGNPNNITALPMPDLESVEPETGRDFNTTEYLPYEDSDLGFSIQYPANWSIDEDSTSHYTVIGFNSPENDASVNVRIIPKGDHESIKEYGDKTFKESEDQTLLGYYRNSSTLLSGEPAFRAIYLTTSNPGLLGGVFGAQSSTSKAMMVATMVPERDSIYAIAYFANSNDFREHLPEVESMINSFKISAKGPTIQEDENEDNSTSTN